MTRICSLIACAIASSVAIAQSPSAMPPVQLSAGHAALCKVKVGDTLPPIELPNRDGAQTNLSDLFGDVATVVVFWKGKGPMSQMALGDLQRDIHAKFASQGVAVVGLAVEETPESADAALDVAGAEFTNLLDAEGTTLSRVGSEKLPRIYLIDSNGKILWFDIEYSLATRRELNQALQVVVRTN